MAGKMKTYLYCFDDHRNFSEDVKKRFSDPEQYNVYSFQAREDLINQLRGTKEHNLCKIAILGLNYNEDHLKLIEEIIGEIKKTDNRTGLILLCTPGKMDDARNKIRHHIDAIIPNNANSILRIHNTIKNIKSERNVEAYRIRRNVSFFILIGSVVLSLIIALYAYFKYSWYF
jgi:hypothetical protein